MSNSQELPGMENIQDMELKKAVDSFVNLKESQAKLKDDIRESETIVLSNMDRVGKINLKIPIGPDVYEFSIVEGKRKIRCRKTTKQPKNIDK